MDDEEPGIVGTDNLMRLNKSTFYSNFLETLKIVKAAPKEEPLKDLIDPK